MQYSYSNIPVTIFKEKDTFIAYTPVLDLATSADSFEKVKKRFEEIVALFFEELQKKGTMDDVLSSLGWIKKTQKWQPPVSVSHSIESIRVPYAN